MANWQPIETAPKDGRDVLLADWRISGGFQQVCHWDDEFHLEWCVKDTSTSYSQGFFTHWQPLPEPPDSEQ